jgi:hypothetical protein
MDEIPILPARIINRISDTKYMCNEKIVIWNGKKLKCVHLKNPAECFECGGSQICEHKKMRNNCKDCGGCGICEHNKKRTVCKDCGGGSLCVHKKERIRCVDCNGSQICEHKIPHHQCKKCGGSSICQHKRIRIRCVDCNGSQICEHKKRKSQCKDCNPNSYLTNIIRHRVSDRLKNYSKNNKKHTMEYVGCTIDVLREHLEDRFSDGMTWENQGDWHIDHIRPCASFNLENESERYMCFHYTNLEPLWAKDNMSKGDFYDPDTFLRKWIVDHWE